LADLLHERTTPELRYLETKWAALLPYGVTVDVLDEVLPLHANHTSGYRHLQQIAEQLEGELGDAQPFFVEGCQRDWDALSLFCQIGQARSKDRLLMRNLSQRPVYARSTKYRIEKGCQP